MYSSPQPTTASNTPWGHYINPEASYQAPGGAGPAEAGEQPWYKSVPWGQAAGGLISGIGSLIGGQGGEDPYAAAEPYLQQIPGELKQYMDPYVQAGQQAIPTLEAQYGALVKDPTALMRSIGGHFQASPGYQYNVHQATDAANRAAAAGGMAGSPAEQAELAKTVTGLSSQDYGQFMKRALGLYGSGLAGWGGLERGGQQAAQQLSENLARSLQSQAGLKEAQAQSQDTQRGGTIGGIAGTLGGLASLLKF